MPYIKKEDREKLNTTINILSDEISSVGNLNYTITKLCLNFLKRSTRSYTSLNEIPGVLECVKLEFYRRAMSLYEDAKISENGDVYIDE